MYNSQYYTCEQIDQRLLQGYLDDYNTENNTNLTKVQFLAKLGSILGVWQGIDDEPTAGSENLVKSGGIFIANTEICAMFNNTLLSVQPIISNYELYAVSELVYNGSKVVKTNSGNRSIIIKIDTDSSITYTFSGERNIALFNSVPKIDDVASSYSMIMQIAGGSCQYAMINFDSTAASFSVAKNKSIKSDIADVNAKTVFAPEFSRSGSYVDGVWTESAGWKSTEMMFAVVGLKIVGFYSRLVTFFDKDGYYISSLAVEDPGGNHIATVTLTAQDIPANAIYLVAGTRNTDLMNSSVSLSASLYSERTSFLIMNYLTNAIFQDYSISDAESVNKNIALHIDNAPNVDKYILNVKCDRQDIYSYRIFFRDTAHSSSSSVLYKNNVLFGQDVVIEKNAAKPSLLINANLSGTFDNPVTYHITLKRYNETIEKNINDIQTEIQTWRGKTIVAFGDSITEFSYNGKRYSDWIEEITGTKVINVGIGGTRICPRASFIPLFDENEEYNVDDLVYYGTTNNYECYRFSSAHTGVWTGEDVSVEPYSILTGYPDLDIANLVAACANTNVPIADRFINQIVAADYLNTHSNDDNRGIVAILPTIDWSKVDAVIVFAGNNDWNASVYGNVDDIEPTTLRGSINYIVAQLLSAYQSIKLYWFTCPPCWIDYSVGQPLPPLSKFSDYYKKSNKTLKEVAEVIKDQVIFNHIPVGDVYNEIGWNPSNFPYYFNAYDGTHPGRGFENIARYMISKIKSYQTFG